MRAMISNPAVKFAPLRCAGRRFQRRPLPPLGIANHPSQDLQHPEHVDFVLRTHRKTLMTSQPVDGYLLHVDGTVRSFHSTLQEAQDSAQVYVAAKSELIKVTSATSSISYRPAGAAPLSQWNYHYDLGRWVQKLHG